MKVLRLDPNAEGAPEAVATLRAGGSRTFNRNGIWVNAPDNHGLRAPLVVKEYDKVEDALKDGCPPPMLRMVL